ncbi:MAG TPA: PQQ-binding-like beta-propeller repeat protein [Mycobacteriales bacterium]|nr:PQQ-binding-like beta-propeller repeat protein [Mycobacteriales bacterium]
MRRSGLLLLVSTLCLTSTATASARGEPPRPDFAARCAILASRGMHGVPQAAVCSPDSMGAAERRRDPDPGVCRPSPGAASRCPKKVARAGSFSSGVGGGALLPDGGAVVHGLDYRTRSGWKLVGVRPDGSQRWKRAHNGGGWINSTVVVDGGRGVIASGYTRGDSYSFVVRRYDARTGSVAWTATPRLKGLPEAVGQGMSLSRDGRTVLLAGYGHKKFSSVRPVVVALDVATGRIRWSREVALDEGTEAGLYFVTLSPDGKTIFAAGDTWDDQEDPFVAALETATGRVKWARRVPGALNDYVYDAQVTSDGRSLVLAGETYLPSYYGSVQLLLAVDVDDGAVQWQHTSALPARGQYWWAFDVVVTPKAVFATLTSSVAVFGSATAFVLVRGAGPSSVVAIDPGEGSPLWETALTPDSGGLLADPRIAASQDGSRVYLAAVAASTTTFAYSPPGVAVYPKTGDLVVQALDAKSGAGVWRSGYNGSAAAPEGSSVGAILVGPAGVHVFADTTPPRYAAVAAYRWETEGLWLTYDH